MAEVIVAPPAPPAPPTAPSPRAAVLPGPSDSLREAQNGLDRFAREPSLDPGSRPDHPSEVARKKNEAAKAAAAKPPEKPTPPAPKPGDPAEVPEPVLEDDPTPPAPAKPGEAPKARKPSDFLREELQKQKARAEAYEKEITALKAPKEDPEKLQLTEKLTAAEKRAQEREDELRYVNYERSEEYQTKYFKPYVEAFNTARHKITSLDVVERTQPFTDPTTGEVTARVVQKGRPATAEDFDAIALTPSDREARNLAKQLFGEDYTIAMAQREKVHELNASRETALVEQRTKGAEREKQQLEARTRTQAENMKRNAELWTSANKEFAEKHPDWFTDVEGDDVANQMLAKDIKTTDSLFGDVSQLPPEKVVRMHSEMRNRAAAAGKLAHLLTKTKARLAEVEAKLKGYEGSEPKDGDGNPIPPTPAAADTMDGLKAGLDRFARERTIFH